MDRKMYSMPEPTETMPKGKEDKNNKKTSVKRQRPKVLRVIFNVLFFGLCFAILAGALSFALDKNEKKAVFGYRIYSVLTDSMTPKADSAPGGFKRGDAIIVKITQADEVKIGDIVTFVPGNDATAYLTHRVVDISAHPTIEGDYLFVTRGDTNNANDPPFSSDRLIGRKVATIPKLGKILQVIKENLILFAVTLAAIFLLVVALKALLVTGKQESADGSKKKNLKTV